MKTRRSFVPAPRSGWVECAPPGLLLVSGAWALVYEVLWMRRLSDLFGATTPAIAATLAAMLLGFTAGNAFWGRYARRLAKPLLVYGGLEIGVGLSALLFEPTLRLYDSFYAALNQALAGSPPAFTITKTVLAILALFLPTFCMGGTLPVLAENARSSPGQIEIGPAGLYAANTWGAALGALSVPFFWLPRFGMRGSYEISVAGSLSIGIMACAIGSWTARQPQRAPAERVQAPWRVCAHPFSKTMLAFLAGLSGLIAFVLQVEWGRMFAQVHENSIYSFAVVLAVMLAGLATGAWLSRQALRLGVTPRNLLGYGWLAGGAIVFVSPHLFYALTAGLSHLEGSGGWGSYGMKILWLALPTVLLPTVLLGMILPMLLELAAARTEEPAGRKAVGSIGSLLGFNTAGSILGALGAAFVLPSYLGVWGSIASAGVILVVAAELTLQPWRKVSLRRVTIFSFLLLAPLYWNPISVPRTHLSADQGEILTALHEGSHGIVAVVDIQSGPLQGSRRMKLDNFYVLGGTASTGDERMQGHLPLLLHAAPRTVAFLGLGTGISAGAGLLHPSVKEVTVVEIVPEIAAAARDYFGQANLNLMLNPCVEVVVDDARHFLRVGRRKFDVIVGDLVVPWRRGESILYSAEHFASARRALAPRGIFCQWLPMFQLSEEEFQIVAATFLDVFPRAALWRGDFAPDKPALALLGLGEEARLEPAQVAKRLQELVQDPANPHLFHPSGVWMFLVGALQSDDPMFTGVRRNSVNAPWLEILGPLAHAGLNRSQLFVGRRLEAYLQQVRQRSVLGTSLEELSAEAWPWREAGARIAEGSLLMNEGKTAEGEAILEQVLKVLPQPSPPASPKSESSLER